MSNSYLAFIKKQDAKSLKKLQQFIKDKGITREQLILFIQKQKQKVFKSETTDDIINRIHNGFPIQYVLPELLKLKIKVKNPKIMSGTAIFYRRKNKDDKKKYKKTIKDHQGNIYFQVKISFCSVNGNLFPYNNKRTYRPILNDPEREIVEMGPLISKYKQKKTLTIDEKQVVETFLEKAQEWKNLVLLLSIDSHLEDYLDGLVNPAKQPSSEDSNDIHCIIIKDAAEGEKIIKEFEPLDDELFSEKAPEFIFHKDITYDINKQAKTFAELFDLNLCKYTLDNWKANSCFINMIVDTWHDEFNKKKSDGKRRFSELTYERVCETLGIINKNQDLGCAIRQSEKFFEKFSLGLDVMNPFGQMIHYYRPKKLHPQIFPQF